jgi:hypothetical protein
LALLEEIELNHQSSVANEEEREQKYLKSLALYNDYQNNNGYVHMELDELLEIVQQFLDKNQFHTWMHLIIKMNAVKS